MTQEEKAKAYDEALAKAVKIHRNYKGRVRAVDVVIEEVFPELKESMDERIRKVLLNDFKNNCSEYYCEGVNRDMIIAWLEKQGEGIDYANKEYWRGYREGKQEILDKYSELEKQCEPKGWTPMDEQHTENLLAIIEGHGYPGEVTWLKSLKYRVRSKSVEWNEEDENIKQSIIDILTKQGFQTQINWLKERYN